MADGSVRGPFRESQWARDVVEGDLDGPHERPGVEPHRAVGVEDSAHGLAAARAAGLVVASVGGVRSADIVCEDLRQLLRLLAVSRGEPMAPANIGAR